MTVRELINKLKKVNKSNKDLIVILTDEVKRTKFSISGVDYYGKVSTQRLGPFINIDIEEIEDQNGLNQKLEKYNDPRPLTDETLQELGFIFDHYFNYTQTKKEGCMNANWWLVVATGELVAIRPQTDHKYQVTFDKISNSPVYNTVGSIKQLLRALKGDEGIIKED